MKRFSVSLSVLAALRTKHRIMLCAIHIMKSLITTQSVGARLRLAWTAAWARVQAAEILTVSALKQRYDNDKNTIMSTLGLSAAEAWRALRHYNWCGLFTQTACRPALLVLQASAAPVPVRVISLFCAAWFLQSTHARL
jgi:hypothetical protein